MKQQTDAIGFVRSHPEMFFPNGKPNPLSCVQHLVVEIIALGAPDVHVYRIENWWLVTSSYDWFQGLSDSEAFERIIALPQVGVNTSRVEIVVSAFADAIVTKDPSGKTSVIKGEKPEEKVWISIAENMRTLAFKFKNV